MMTQQVHMEMFLILLSYSSEIQNVLHTLNFKYRFKNPLVKFVSAYVYSKNDEKQTINQTNR